MAVDQKSIISNLNRNNVGKRVQKTGKVNIRTEQSERTSFKSYMRQFSASLVVNKQVIPLSKEITKLGRHLENDFVFHEEFLSRFQAEIVLENGQYVLYDKNSTGGTYVNVRKIDRCILNSGDLISLVNIQIMFVNNYSTLVSKSTGITQGLGAFRNER
jgi:pSer/pThr/pTyr-binding forkhead associated (FHA) protein